MVVTARGSATDTAGLRVQPKSTQNISVVIPCLNEVRTIARCVSDARSAIAALRLDGEVIVADNGSSDGSIEAAERAGARLIKVAEKGYGAAVRAGVEAARSETIVIGDGDGQHDFSAIAEFVAKLDSGCDLVVGDRFSGKLEPGSMKWSHRYIGNPFLSGLLRLLFGQKVHDAQCGMRAVRKTAFLRIDLRTSGFELCPEMVIKAARAKLSIGEVPITVAPDGRGRPPHLKTVPDGWRHLMFLLMCAPNWLFIAPGGGLLCLGVFIVSWLFAGPHSVAAVGLATRSELFGVLLASLGFQIMSIGMFARVFSYSAPLHFRAPAIDRVLSRIKLEQGLLLGAVLIAVGLAGGIYDYVSWAEKGFGIFQHNRAIIFFALWLVLGIQICFSSLFLSMIGVSRSIWIGSDK